MGYRIVGRGTVADAYQDSCFLHVQVCRMLAEVVAAGSFHAVALVAIEIGIAVKLHNVCFGVLFFNLRGQKDFHNFIYHTDRPLKDIIRPVLFITPTMKIGVLLKKLQDSKTHIAIILDEFGGTEGLVTIEDIIEELVGDIWDEHDRVIKEIEKISDREYLMSGSANIDKVFELLDIEKAVDVNTLSGWIMEELGQIPKEGDSFVSDGVKVVVLKMDDHRVDKAKVYQNVQNNAENEGNQEK